MGKKVVMLLLLVILAASGIIIVKPAFASSDAENSWVSKAPLNVAMSGLGAAVVNGRIYAIGGYALNATGGYGLNGIIGTNEEYDAATDTWTNKTSMPTPRYDFAIATYNNKIYCIGGFLPDGSTTGINEAYDPSTDTWQTRMPMPTNRAEMNANDVNGRIYVIGGRTGGPYSTVNITEVYDPVSDSWTQGESMPYPLVSYASAVVDNKIYVIGGQDEFRSDMNVAFNQIYDPQTDNWSQGAPIPVPTLAAAGATTGLVAPKRIYVIGGSAGFGEGSNQNYVYDTQANVWTNATLMPTARYTPAVAVVNDQLYVIGGGDAMTVLTTNEQYTPIGFGTIPEFPSTITFVFTALMAATLIMGIIYRRKSKR